ncbi:MAG: SDR family oxidoreductase [Bacteriovorax sp.]|jgi:NAD(P)-dependent dehydrogenase (short-subunit alcohol dehydrogenase family)
MKSVILTGVSQGIGKAIYEMLDTNNYNVIGIDMKDAPFCKNFIKGDLSDKNFVEGLTSKIPDPIVGIINNAALQIEKNLIETTYEEWNKVFQINVHAPFLLAKIFINQMVPGSSIINISSVHAKATSPGLAAYVASKGALSAMTRSMALEFGSRHIRVNAILPGAIETPMLMSGLSRNGDSKSALEKLKSQSPLNKIGSGSDIAQLVAFLLNSDLSGNITGQEFVCDSGILAKLASE